MLPPSNKTFIQQGFNKLMLNQVRELIINIKYFNAGEAKFAKFP